MATSCTPIERIMGSCMPEPNSGCWLFLLHRDRQGYGKATYKGRPLLAHRVAYELIVGPIPSGYTLDHLCRNPSCINPIHLEPVTQEENTMRGFSPPAQHARATHCKHGHAFNEANTYRGVPKRRGCRACNRDAARRMKQRRLAESGAVA